MESCSTFWLPDITDWWRQQDKMHSKYTNLSNVGCDIFPITPQGDEVEDSFSLGRDEIRWRQWKTTSESLRQEAVVRQFA
jgi:hypothetical protein